MDLRLTAQLPHHNYGFDEGAQDFFRVLRMIEKLPAFDLGWSMGDYYLWDQKTEFLEEAKSDSENAGYADEFSSIDINDDAVRVLGTEKVYYTFGYYWGIHSTRFTGEFRRPHPRYGTQAQQFINLIEVVTKWKRPQHLRFGSTFYLVNHHPLSRQHVGIGWMGWIPFDVPATDVPEAEIVRPMNNGTLIVTQSQFWLPVPGHPNYSKAAIERAQEVEIRLNLLGVLPAALDLNRGDWGQ